MLESSLVKRVWLLATVVREVGGKNRALKSAAVPIVSAQLVPISGINIKISAMFE